MKQLYLLIFVMGITFGVFAQPTLNLTASTTTVCFGGSSTLTANISGGTSYTWSPASGLSSTTGSTVTAIPPATTTYTVTATAPSGTSSQQVTITVDPTSFTLAGSAGGSQVCGNTNVSGSGTFYRNNNCELIAKVVPAGLSPVTGSINACVKVEPGPTRYGTLDYYAARRYDIEPSTNAATATADVTFYYTQSEFDDYNLRAQDSGFAKLPIGPSDATGITNIRLRQFHGTGTNPTNYTGSVAEFRSTSANASMTWNSTYNWWEITVRVNGFSGFYLTTKKSELAVLPVNLEYFRLVEKGKHQLAWKLNCTSDQNIIELERSADGVQYSFVESWMANPARCILPFRWEDPSPLQGKNYYRLKFRNADGNFTYSNTVVAVPGINSNNFALAPTVTTGNTFLKVNAPSKSRLYIIITDATGKRVSEQNVMVEPGSSDLVLETSEFRPGVYFIKAMLDGDQPVTLRLLKK